MIDTLGIGGAERLLETTLKLLPEYRNIVCFLSKPDNLESRLEAEKIFFLDFRSNLDILSCAYKLRKIIDHYSPQLVHSHLLKSTWTSRLASWRKCPLVFTIHNYLSEDAFKVNRYAYYFEKFSYSEKQTILSVSKAALVDYKQWISAKGKSHVLYNVIADSFFEAEKKTIEVNESGTFKILAVGSLRRQKNYINLVKAFCFLKEENINLHIYGQGDEFEEIDALIKEHALPVQMKGQTDNIASVLNKYDAFIMASLFEGYGIAPVEAMAVGLPLILSDIEVFREITNSQAIFFNPNQPQSIAEAIKKYINLPSEAKTSLSEYGIIKSRELASKESFQKNLKSIYTSVITDK